MKRIRCPGCGRALRYGEDRAGKRIKCPACTHAFRLPGGHEVAEAPARQEGDDPVQGSCCLACGGKADPARDAYTFHGYVKRKERGIKLGLVTSTIRYAYEGYHEETGLVCPACVGAARRRLVLILLLVYGVGWAVLFGVVIYHNAVEKISEGTYAAVIVLIIASVVALVVLWVNDVVTREFAGRGLALRHNRDRLLDMGLRVVGRGSLQNQWVQ
jgi:hypothetical protein